MFSQKKFIYLFLLKKLCLFYNPRRGKMTHSYEKVGGCSRSSCSFTCLMVDHTTAQIKVVRKSLYVVASYRGITLIWQLLRP